MVDRVSVVGLSVALVVSLSVGSAAAQTPPVPGDVVRLANGGMVRGAIIELVPDGHVAIQLPDGSTRVFAMTEVAYAGPASEMPGQAATPVSGGQPRQAPPEWAPPPSGYGAPPQYAPHPQMRRPFHRIRLHGPEGFTYHLYGLRDPELKRLLVRSSRRYHGLCTAPCDVALPSGSYTFALGPPGGRAVNGRDAIQIDAPTAVTAEYHSRRGVRVVTGILGALLAGSGAALVAFRGFGLAADDPDIRLGAVISGAAMILGGIITVNVGIRRRDVVRFDVAALPETPSG